MSTDQAERAAAADAPEPAAGAGGAAANPSPPTGAPSLGPFGLLRWAWRQLTSMRTALVLLFLLALAAVPGSIVPQSKIDAAGVARWHRDHPSLAPVYDRLGLFSVYSSPWFSAIYLLLMVSLVGCIVPRLRVYWRGMRARPPRTPRHLDRLPASRRWESDDAPEVVLETARQVLRGRHYRVDVRDEGGAGAGSVGAERGYLREAGNLLFHVSVLVVLVGFAWGQLYGYKGGVITIVGDSFTNVPSQFDDLAPGSLFDVDDLPPLSLRVRDFHVSWVTSGADVGQPSSFDADIDYRLGSEQAAHRYDLRVNHPLDLHGVSVFLVGHGYAPVVTVRDRTGRLAYRGPAVFLPQDSSFRSFGVIKVTGAQPQQLGFQGLLLPTYGFSMATGPVSRFPEALDPVLSMTPYHGDLGLAQGEQSVYALDLAAMKPWRKASGQLVRVDLALGKTATLPDGATIRFDRVDRWVKLQVSNSPGKGLALGGVLAGIAGLLGSLFIRPRRAWVRVRREPPAGGDRSGREPVTVVELAGLDRSSGGNLEDEIDELERRLRAGAREGDVSVDNAFFADVSNKAVMFAGIVYALALLAHVVEWARGRQLPAAEAERVAEPVAVGAGGSGAATSYPPDVDDAELRVETAGRIGLSLTVLAVLLHGVGLVSRGLAADPIRVPWGNMYEFTLAGTLGVGVMYLALMKRYHLRWMGLVVTAFEVVVLMLAGLFLYVPAGPLVPSLHSYWLAIHVTAAILASGAFAVGALASALFLVKQRAQTRGRVRPGGYLDRLPELQALDRVAYRLHAFGFPIWTFAALVAGPIWAEYAWGSYWNWDPKEVWAFISWVVYAAYLHARATAGWKGRTAAIIALVGFATLLFNFVGINYFFGGGSMHSYAGR